MGNYNNLSDWAKACSDAINQIKGTTYKMAPRHFPKIIDEIELEGLPSGLDSTTAPPQLLPLMSDIANSIRRKCSCVDCSSNRKKIKPSDFPEHILKISPCEHEFNTYVTKKLSESPYWNNPCDPEDVCLVSYYVCDYCGTPKSDTPDTTEGHYGYCIGECKRCGVSLPIGDHDWYIEENIERNRAIDFGLPLSEYFEQYGAAVCMVDFKGCPVCDYDAYTVSNIRMHSGNPCTICGFSTGDSSGDECQHKFNEIHGNDNPDGSGERTYECEICGYTYVVTWDSEGNKTWSDISGGGGGGGVEHSHYFRPVKTVSATCEEDGYFETACSCGETLIIPLEAPGHDMQYIPAKDPTCTEPGYTAHKKCKNCDYMEGYVEIPAGHPEDKIEYKFDESGHWQFCNQCNSNITPVEGHTIETREATHDYGSCKPEEEYCTICDYYYPTSTGSHPIKYSHDAPNCIGTCDCGLCTNTEYNVVLVEGEVITEATCTDEGLRHMDCPYCNEHITTEAIPVDENAHKITWSTEDTGCDQCGDICTVFIAGEHGICDLCGQHFAGFDGSYEVHDWSNQDGICARCSAKCEHEEGYNEATCCSYKTCKTCGLAEGEYDENNHVNLITEYNYKDSSTCKVYEYYETCEACGYENYSTDSSTDHDYVDGICTGCGAIDPDREYSVSEEDCSHPNMQPINDGEYYWCPDCGYNWG